MEVDGDTPAKRVATGGKHRCQHVHGEISSGGAAVFKVGQVVPANPRERLVGEDTRSGVTGGGLLGG